MKKTQNQRVLEYLQTGAQLTQFEALNHLGILRLASRISDLKNEGYTITSRLVSVSNRFGETCKVAAYTLHDVRGAL